MVFMWSGYSNSYKWVLGPMTTDGLKGWPGRLGVTHNPQRDTITTEIPQVMGEGTIGGDIHSYS